MHILFVQMFHHRTVYQREEYQFDSRFDKMHLTLEFAQS